MNAPKKMPRSRLDCTAEPCTGVARSSGGLLNLRTALAETVVRATPGRKLWEKTEDGIKQFPCRCWTQRTERPLARFGLFKGFTAPELKFRSPAFGLPAA